MIYLTIKKLLDEINIDNSIIVTNIRHKEIIKKAIKDTQKAIEHINKNLPIDMVAFFIKDILEDLGEITGETVTDEIIKEIFSRFCLGK